MRKQYEFVPRDSLEKMQLVSIGAVVYEVLVPARDLLDHISQRENNSIDEFRLFVERKSFGL